MNSHRRSNWPENLFCDGWDWHANHVDTVNAWEDVSLSQVCLGSAAFRIECIDHLITLMTRQLGVCSSALGVWHFGKGRQQYRWRKKNQDVVGHPLRSSNTPDDANATRRISWSSWSVLTHVRNHRVGLHNSASRTFGQNQCFERHNDSLFRAKPEVP